MVLIRNPAAAGQFYARFKPELIKSIEKCFNDSEFGPGAPLIIGNAPADQPRQVLGAICPHAGYIYSGPAAAYSYQSIFKERVPDTVIILGTQHTGYYQVATMISGIWKTPLGQVKVDEDVAKTLVQDNSPIIPDDAAFNGFPHGREHNIEVQIPFIQYATLQAKKSIQIVPLKIGSMDASLLEKVAIKIAEVIQSSSTKDIAIIASSDMTHYQPRNPYSPKKEIELNQYERDKKVISAFESFNWRDTFSNAKKTTVCGPQTIATLMITAEKLGYGHPHALKYYTSFQKMGEQVPCDYSVGYFAGAIKR
ncbi:MAG: AmmeMemoRadiSam system protein B [Promethearchaeota archaeon]